MRTFIFLCNFNVACNQTRPESILQFHVKKKRETLSLSLKRLRDAESSGYVRPLAHHGDRRCRARQGSRRRRGRRSGRRRGRGSGRFSPCLLCNSYRRRPRLRSHRRRDRNGNVAALDAEHWSRSAAGRGLSCGARRGADRRLATASHSTRSGPAASAGSSWRRAQRLRRLSKTMVLRASGRRRHGGVRLGHGRAT